MTRFEDSPSAKALNSLQVVDTTLEQDIYDTVNDPSDAAHAPTFVELLAVKPVRVMPDAPVPPFEDYQEEYNIVGFIPGQPMKLVAMEDVDCGYSLWDYGKTGVNQGAEMLDGPHASNDTYHTLGLWHGPQYFRSVEGRIASHPPGVKSLSQFEDPIKHYGLNVISFEYPENTKIYKFNGMEKFHVCVSLTDGKIGLLYLDQDSVLLQFLEIQDDGDTVLPAPLKISALGMRNLKQYRVRCQESDGHIILCVRPPNEEARALRSETVTIWTFPSTDALFQAYQEENSGHYDASFLAYCTSIELQCNVDSNVNSTPVITELLLSPLGLVLFAEQTCEKETCLSSILFFPFIERRLKGSGELIRTVRSDKVSYLRFQEYYRKIICSGISSSGHHMLLHTVNDVRWGGFTQVSFPSTNLIGEGSKLKYFELLGTDMECDSEDGPCNPHIDEVSGKIYLHSRSQRDGKEVKFFNLVETTV